jgi:glycosyltransferase 2 family protein
MPSPVRTLLVLAAVAALFVLFLWNVDLRAVGVGIAHARPEWLVLSLAMFALNLLVRSRRWQFLLAPLAHVSFANSFRATAVGFGANNLLPARAGEVMRPYFLSRHEPVSATAAFATIILERLLDVVAVLALLASYILLFGRGQAVADPAALAAVRWAGVVAAAAAVAVLGALLFLSGRPDGLDRVLGALEHMLPAALVGLARRLVDKFSTGLAVVRRPSQLLPALFWSFPLWLIIGVGIWSGARAFDLPVPFTGSFLMIAILVIGGAVPTPGAIGGFHEAFRVGATTFFGAREESAVGAALVLHAISVTPSIVLGSVFLAQAGLSFGTMRQLADQAEAGRPANP